jgi:hypothetical protein
MANSKSELPYLNPEFYLNFTFCAKRQGRTDPATLVIKLLALICHFLSLPSLLPLLSIIGLDLRFSNQFGRAWCLDLRQFGCARSQPSVSGIGRRSLKSLPDSKPSRERPLSFGAPAEISQADDRAHHKCQDADLPAARGLDLQLLVRPQKQVAGQGDGHAKGRAQQERFPDPWRRLGHGFVVIRRVLPRAGIRLSAHPNVITRGILTRILWRP